MIARKGLKILALAFTTAVCVNGCQLFADKLSQDSKVFQEGSKEFYTQVPTLCVLSMDKASEAMENVSKALSYPVDKNAFTKSCQEFKRYSKDVTKECPLSEEDYELWESTYDGLDCLDSVIQLKAYNANR